MSKMDELRKEYLDKNSKLMDSKFSGPLEGLIDPPILEIVRELNGKGFDTIQSCAGGHKVDGYSKEYYSPLDRPQVYQSRGYITFSRRLTKIQREKVRKMASSFGLKNVKFSDDNRQLQFRGLGGGQAPGWDEYREDMDKLDRKYIDKGKRLEKKNE